MARKQKSLAETPLDELIDTGNPYNAGDDAPIPPGPWDRRPNESPEAYLAFEVYRRLGPARNLQRVTGITRAIREDLKAKGQWKQHVGILSESQALPRNEAVTAQKVGTDVDTLDEDGDDDGGERKAVGGTRIHQILTIYRDKTYDDVPVNSRIGMWSHKNDWGERVAAWDEYIYTCAREQERRLRQEESIGRSVQERVGREMLQRIYLGLLQKILDQVMAGGALDAKSLRDITLAAERVGLVRQNAYHGIKDLLEDESADQASLPMNVAARLMAAMAEVAAEHQPSGLWVEPSQPPALEG